MGRIFLTHCFKKAKHLSKGGIEMTEKEQRQIFSRNLNDYITENGKSQKQVALDLGIHPTTFNTWCVGRVLPRMCIIEQIAEYFHIRKTDLLSDKSLRTRYHSHTCLSIPVVSSYSPSLSQAQLTERIVGTEEISEERIGTSDFIGIKVSDTCMAPRIFPGDIAIIRRQPSVSNGDIACISLENKPAILRKYLEHTASFVLLPMNPTCEPLYFSGSPSEHTELQIIGRMTELRSRF